MPTHNKLDPTTLIGKKFNRMTIIEYVAKTDCRTHRVLAQCDCGVTKECTYNNLRSGGIKSCGCLVRNNKSIGDRERKHGLYKHPLFRVWHAMRSRCYDSTDISYPNYGAKGVKVCKEWLDDIKSFYEWAISNGWKHGLQLDKDKLAPNKRGKLYSPKYCCFITPKENMMYRNNTLIIKYNGEKKPLLEWAITLGLRYDLLIKRHANGWSPKRMFETPLNVNKLVKYNNEKQSLVEWCRRLNRDRRTVSSRIHQLGWSYEKALSTPTKKAYHG